MLVVTDYIGTNCHDECDSAAVEEGSTFFCTRPCCKATQEQDNADGHVTTGSVVKTNEILEGACGS